PFRPAPRHRERRSRVAIQCGGGPVTAVPLASAAPPPAPHWIAASACGLLAMTVIPHRRPQAVAMR
ncbi:MAG TPA: hypothetical protein PK214_02025, partial [Ottowia sp.]|nr:hypothetical protein [Ottowia sp.]HON30340.1 hypothetical protein [Ottowia sp.]HQX66647.1 hypothetical protein [Ottowia sp.]HQZ55878.1 hypothetical protein [Ottowia sp.]